MLNDRMWYHSNIPSAAFDSRAVGWHVTWTSTSLLKDLLVLAVDDTSAQGGGLH